MKVIDGKTKLTGLFGWPVGHTFSPLLHNSAFERLGLNYVYLPFAVQPESLAEAVESIRALNICGVNVTIPHKEKIMPYLDKVDEAARLIGAVNTVVNDNGRLIGYNTDGPGFAASLKDELSYSLAGKRMLLIGAGGAAKAVAVQSALSGLKELVIVNRNTDKARLLADSAAKTGCSVSVLDFAALNQDLMHKIDLVVDTSPVGMYPNVEAEPVIAPELLHSGLLVCDLVYNPEKTVLLKAAEKAGAVTWSGLGMLVQQGALAFQYWTGMAAPVEIMTKALKDYLYEKR